MILVEIYAPALEKTYDFQVEENVPVENLVLEIAEMIGNENKSGKKVVDQNFMLCLMDKGVILKKTATLQEYEIKNGAYLMIV